MQLRNRETAEALHAGLDKLRKELGVPGDFDAEVLAAAEVAANRVPDASSGHVDRTDVPFLTLDPASSTDLDQAFAIEWSGSAPGGDLILRYAIADVGFFVDHGDRIDEAAWTRGNTFYLPDGRATLYPPVLCERAASLLPDGPRPAVVFIVRIDGDGNSSLDGVERAVVLNRAKLGYEDVTEDDLPDGFAELSRRIVAAEDRRGAPRVEFPEQELARVDGRWELTFRPRLESEDQNAGMSLATNLAVADVLVAAKTGLFRVMSDVDERSLWRLRHTARAVGLDWPRKQSLASFQRSLSTSDPRASAFLLAVRRASGGASFQPYEEGVTPWHSALAATYAQATAPLRRLPDRYVIEGALAVVNGDQVPEEVLAAYEKLPDVMAEASSLANRVDNAVYELAEAVLLAGREGEIFDGVIVDDDRNRDPTMQIADPAVLVPIRASNVEPGDEVRARLVATDVDTRKVDFERVS